MVRVFMMETQLGKYIYNISHIVLLKSTWDTQTIFIDLGQEYDLTSIQIPEILPKYKDLV